MAKNSRIRTRFTLLVTALMVSGTAVADDFRGYWQRGAVIDWSTPPKANSSSDITIESHTAEYQKKRLEEIMKQAAANNPAQPGQQNLQTPAAHAGQERPSPERPMSRDDIVAKFGRPDEERFVLAQKDAPPEFQAMLLALNQGDKELAFEYARSYARRMDKMANLVTVAAQYQGIAREVEGFAPDSPDSEEGRVDGVRAELLPYIERAKAERKKKTVDLEKSLAAAEGVEVEADAPVAATQRKDFSDVPVDPAGKVKMLVFFNENDEEKVAAITETLRTLKQRLPTGTDFQVLGLTRKTYTKDALKLLGAKTTFPFPLVNGEALSQQVRIHRYPTFLFMALTSKQLYRLEGIQTPEDIEKVVRLMRGGH